MPAAPSRPPFEVDPPPRRAGPHKRLRFTSAQWAVLAGLAPGPLPACLRPAAPPAGSTGSDDAVDELRSTGVLVEAADVAASAEVARSLALLSGAPVAVHAVVSSRVLTRESWWAMDPSRVVAAFTCADGGVEWVVAGAADAAALLSASVPGIAELDPRATSTASGISAGLGAPPSSPDRERFSLPLALMSGPDPLRSVDGADGDHHGRVDRDVAAAFVPSIRGTLTTRVHALTWNGGTPAPAVGTQVWFATAAGWWATSAEPRSAQAARPAERRVRITPVDPEDVARSLAPMLTTAFSHLAAASSRVARGAGRPAAGEMPVDGSAGDPEGPAAEGQA